jgi:hypothetical protein
MRFFLLMMVALLNCLCEETSASSTDQVFVCPSQESEQGKDKPCLTYNIGLRNYNNILQQTLSGWVKINYRSKWLKYR